MKEIRFYEIDKNVAEKCGIVDTSFVYDRKELENRLNEYMDDGVTSYTFEGMMRYLNNGTLDTENNIFVMAD